MKIKLWIVALLTFSCGLQARYYVAKNDNQFVDELNKHEFAVVCFTGYIDDAMNKGDQKKMKKDIHLLHDTIKATAETDPYKKLLKQEVAFIMIDVTKDSMEPFMKKYNIKLAQTPQILLFKNGKAITDMSEKFAKLSGFISKSDLLDFMNNYWGKDFYEILAQKADEEQQDRDMEMARYQAFAASRYPYGGYAPYNVWGSPSGQIYTGYAAFYPYGYSYNGFAYMIP